MNNTLYVGTNTKIMFDPTITYLIHTGQEYSTFKMNTLTGVPKYVIWQIDKINNRSSISEECFTHAINMGWLVEKRTYIIEKILE